MNYFLNLYQMDHLFNHPTYGGLIFVFNRLL